MVDWEWYGDRNTMAVFIHLLLIVNHKDGSWRGVNVLRGQKITSVSIIADQLGLSSRNVRTAIKHLKSTGEIEVKTTSHYSVITVVKFDTYNASEKQGDKPSDKPVTNKRQASDNKQEWKKERMEEETPLSGKPDLAAEVFSHWQKRFNHGNAKLDAKRRNILNSALRAGYSTDDLKKAIEGCALTPHNMGDNDRHQKYDGVHIIFKSENIDRFIATADSPQIQTYTNDQSGHAAAERRLIG